MTAKIHYWIVTISSLVIQDNGQEGTSGISKDDKDEADIVVDNNKEGTGKGEEIAAIDKVRQENDENTTKKNKDNVQDVEN
ncbi:hypothetical protein HAX54_043872 [Datura stramonium]|uniref:Uncharacterized protein n=1 Tax=Datura stramonium TaxID=4076 RepID=A0ABS8SNN3_DATST|nr:hypothetical protein [Datura stramonium]